MTFRGNGNNQWDWEGIREWD